MIEKNSFTDFIKYEILNFEWKEDEKKILIYVFLFSIRKIINANNNFSFKSYLSPNNKDPLSKLIKETLIPQNIEISDLKNSFLFFIEKDNVDNEISNFIKNIKINSIEDSKILISGVFLASGTITSPISKFYHFEITFFQEEIFLLLKKAFSILRIKFSTFKKNEKYHLYIKKATAISDIIKALNASNALLYFEDQRILRDLTSNLKKTEAIEPYNKIKILKAVKIQINAINKIKKEDKFDKLGENLQELANLRIKYPENSLSELSYLYNDLYKKNVSKSTINAWMKKIINIANEGK